MRDDTRNCTHRKTGSKTINYKQIPERGDNSTTSTKGLTTENVRVGRV